MGCSIDLQILLWALKAKTDYFDSIPHLCQNCVSTFGCYTCILLHEPYSHLKHKAQISSSCMPKEPQPRKNVYDTYFPLVFAFKFKIKFDGVKKKEKLPHIHWTPPDGHEGDLVFISGRLRSVSGRLFDGIFNASFQAFFTKIRKEF